MSGHSKWSTIKHKKAANDLVKGSVFTKMAKAITIAVKKGGGVSDPAMNFSLRLAIDKARAVNMPKENIDRAVEKGLGVGGEEMVELLIEGFAPEGVAVMIVAVTDNRNRTMSEMRILMEKQGGVMGSMGSVAYMFDKTQSGYEPKYLSSVANPTKVKQFIQALEENDDVQEVYANLG